MNGADPVMFAVAAVMTAAFLLFLLVFFVHFRLWVQALLAGTGLGLLDIIGMRLRRCPPRLLVHAAITLSQRGVKVPARELEGYYLAAAVRGERPETAAELAALVEAVKRNEAPQT
jgi:uncharacterized protein YqfA (UPF0365 family)